MKAVIALGVLMLVAYVTDVSAFQASKSGDKPGKSGKVVHAPGEFYTYHFHPTFFQKNKLNTEFAVNLREKLIGLIKKKVITHCSVSQINNGPFGAYPIGNFEMCCNRTSLTPAVSWLMQNHGNLSVQLHPVTKNPRKDITYSSMWLGQPVPLDLKRKLYPAPPCQDNSKSVTYTDLH